MRLGFVFLLTGSLIASAGELPLVGITHVAVRVTDLAKSQDFYGRALGLEQPFEFNDHGRTVVAFMKVNDRQYIELYPGLPTGEKIRLAHICLETTDIEAVRRRMEEAGLAPTKIVKARAGNLLFAVKDPDGQMIEFLQYLPGSLHIDALGKGLGARRISRRIHHAGVAVKDLQASIAFYRDKLGLIAPPVRPGARSVFLRVPGPRGDSIELISYDAPPDRDQIGSMQHIALEVEDAAAARRELAGRGVTGITATPGNRTSLDVRDPDGTRVQLIQPAPDPAPLAHWRAVANKLLATPPDSFAFNWGEGVQMIGMMKIFERTRHDPYAEYVAKWAAVYAGRDVRKLLGVGQTKVKLPGYCGHWSPATAILYLYEARKRPEHLRLAVQVADFIRKGAERAPEGALSHWIGNHQLWVDTLYMACPLLARLGTLEKRPEYIDDAAGQIIAHARPLQDAETGLFYHMWDWKAGERSHELWGRGNGWTLMSIADTMEEMPRTHRAWSDLKRIAEQMVRGLEASQDENGMWHTVMNDPRSYPESSATSMFCYGLLKLARLGVLPGSVRPMALRAWRALTLGYVRDGVVTGVSAGTIPKGGDYYRNVPLGSQTWGTGAYLMAGSEVDRLNEVNRY